MAKTERVQSVSWFSCSSGCGYGWFEMQIKAIRNHLCASEQTHTPKCVSKPWRSVRSLDITNVYIQLSLALVVLLTPTALYTQVQWPILSRSQNWWLQYLLQHFYISNLLLRHWHVLQEFRNCMRHTLQCTAIKCNAHKQNVKIK